MNLPELAERFTDGFWRRLNTYHISTSSKVGQEPVDVDSDHSDGIAKRKNLRQKLYGSIPSGTSHGCISISRRPAWTAGSVSANERASSSVPTRNTNMPRRF